MSYARLLRTEERPVMRDGVPPQYACTTRMDFLQRVLTFFDRQPWDAESPELLFCRHPGCATGSRHNQAVQYNVLLPVRGVDAFPDQAVGGRAANGDGGRGDDELIAL